MDGVEPFAGHVGRGAVGKVAAHVDAHAEYGVAWLEYCEENALVGLAAGMRLHIREFAGEHLLRTLNGQLFGHIDRVAAAVIALAGIAFRIFVGEHGAGRFQYRARDVILRSDQFDLVLLARELIGQDRGDLWVGFAERCREELA
jgi:hypothetical protein